MFSRPLWEVLEPANKVTDLKMVLLLGGKDEMGQN